MGVLEKGFFSGTTSCASVVTIAAAVTQRPARGAKRHREVSKSLTPIHSNRFPFDQMTAALDSPRPPNPSHGNLKSSQTPRNLSNHF